MAFNRKFLPILLAGLITSINGCIGGIQVKGKAEKDGWILFENAGASHLWPATKSNQFWKNENEGLVLAEFTSKDIGLTYKKYSLEFDDGSRPTFHGVDWFLGYKPESLLMISLGRGFSIWDLNKLPKPIYSPTDMNINFVSNGWMYVAPDYSYAIVPRDVADPDFKLGFVNPPSLMLRYEISNQNLDTHELMRHAESWLGPEFILLRYFQKEDERATDRWAALDFNLKEIEPPFVKLLNSIRDSVGDIFTFELGSKGFSLFSKEAENIATNLFLASTQNELKVYPLYNNGTDPILSGQGSQSISIAPDGQHFLVSVRVESPREVDEERLRSAVYIGKVEWVNGKPAPKLKFLKDFPKLINDNPFVWFSNSDGFVVANEQFSGKPRLWIYDLNKNPIDWSTVPIALEKK